MILLMILAYSALTMNAHTFQQFRTLVYEHSGIDLAPGKEALVKGRVSKRMRHLGMSDERSYLKFVMGDSSGDEMVQLLDAISTNTTHFFREDRHFHYLTERLLAWRGAGRALRIWSAASSTGEEPYSIAMTCAEAIGLRELAQRDVRILATDISTRVLRIARVGVYRISDLSSVPPALRQQYFEPLDDEQAQVIDDLQQVIAFRRLNLSKPPFPMRGPFDVIFIRNVMIYFDRAVRARLIAEAERLLRVGGVLMIGHAESLSGIPTRLAMVTPSIYEKVSE